MSSQLLTPGNSMADACWYCFIVASRIVLLVPVFVVFGIMALDWYSFVIEFALTRQHDYPVAVAIAVAFFHVSLFMTIWSYLRTILTSSAVRDNPPPPSYLTAHDANNNTLRRCPRCDSFKPQRSHHCSICNTCILKMDHHCPWVSNCVGFKNYKFFILFLVYATLSSYIYQIAGITLIVAMFQEPAGKTAPPFATLLATLMTSAFAVALTAFTGFHLMLIAADKTTIEVSADRRDRMLARRNNGDSTNDTQTVPSAVTVDESVEVSHRSAWQTVFGRSVGGWFVPIDFDQLSGYESEVGESDELTFDYDRAHAHNADLTPSSSLSDHNIIANAVETPKRDRHSIPSDHYNDVDGANYGLLSHVLVQSDNATAVATSSNSLS